MAVIWIIVAFALVAGAIVVAARVSRSMLPPLDLPPGERLPTTPVQRVMRWSVALGLVPMAAAGIVIASVGPTAWENDDAIRLTVTGLLLLSLALLASPMVAVGIWAARDSGALDERDRAIISRAPAGQAASMLIVLAVWMIALQEAYRGTPGVPREFLNLIFWSCLLVSFVASNVGVLIGYRRS